jgi:hypothetical protein
MKTGFGVHDFSELHASVMSIYADNVENNRCMRNQGNIERMTG